MARYHGAFADFPSMLFVIKRKSVLRALAIVLSIVLALVLLFTFLPLPKRGLFGNGLPPGGDFVLNSADGPVALKDFRGKAVLLYFGYTYCPDVCPTGLASHAEALRLLPPADAARVAVLFVSVDPERDTPAHLKQYAAFFHPAFLGLTGDTATLQQIARRYGVFYARQPATAGLPYSVDHTADSFLIAPDGQLLSRLPYGQSPADTASAVRRALTIRPSAE